MLGENETATAGQDQYPQHPRSSEQTIKVTEEMKEIQAEKAQKRIDKFTKAYEAELRVTQPMLSFHVCCSIMSKTVRLARAFVVDIF